MTDEHRGYAAAIVSYLSVATSFIGMKWLIGASSVFTAEILFFILGGLLSCGLLLVYRGNVRFRSISRNAATYMQVSGLMAYVATSTFVCIDLIGPGPVAFVSQTEIVFGVLLGGIVLGERLGWLDALGGFLAMSGALYMTYSPGEYMKVGVLLMLFSAFALAVHNLVVKRHAAQIDKLELLVVRAATALFVIVLLAAATNGLSWPPIWLVPLGVATALVGFVMANFFRYTALSYIEMGKVSILRVIAPIAVLILSFSIFHTVPDVPEIIGGGLILIGISIMLSQPILRTRSTVPKDSH